MIEIEQRGAVAVLHLRHGKANALDSAFCRGITQTFEEMRVSAARAVVLGGAGSIFSAGVDLMRVLSGGRAYVDEFLPALNTAFEAVFNFPRPVVAAVNGHAIAGGCVLACAADQRVMAQGEGRIGVPELLVGVPFPTIALEIMRLVAPATIDALIYGGGTLTPEEAVRHGLIHATSEPARLLELAVARAENLAALPAEAFALTKRQMRAPAMKRVREDGPEFDATVRTLWAAPATHAAIEAYAARTFRKPK